MLTALPLEAVAPAGHRGSNDRRAGDGGVAARRWAQYGSRTDVGGKHVVPRRRVEVSGMDPGTGAVTRTRNPKCAADLGSVGRASAISFVGAGKAAVVGGAAAGRAASGPAIREKVVALMAHVVLATPRITLRCAVTGQTGRQWLKRRDGCLGRQNQVERLSERRGVLVRCSDRGRRTRTSRTAPDVKARTDPAGRADRGPQRGKGPPRFRGRARTRSARWPESGARQQATRPDDGRASVALAGCAGRAAGGPATSRGRDNDDRRPRPRRQDERVEANRLGGIGDPA